VLNHLGGSCWADGDYRDDAMLTTAANNALALNITVPERRGGEEATAERRKPHPEPARLSYGTERAAAEQAVSVLVGRAQTSRDDIEITYDLDPRPMSTCHVQEALDRVRGGPRRQERYVRGGGHQQQA